MIYVLGFRNYEEKWMYNTDLMIASIYNGTEI